jgi:hypothetical protein
MGSFALRLARMTALSPKKAGITRAESTPRWISKLKEVMETSRCISENCRSSRPSRLVIAGCTSASVGNAISGATGGRGDLRAIDAAPSEPGPLSLVVASTTINSNLSASVPVGTYALIGAGNQNIQISPTNVPTVSKSFAASVFYTAALVGEPGQADFGLYIFEDTNATASSATVRYKVNDAAPAPGPIDVYVYQGATLPNLPTVPGLTVGNDSGSITNPPGNSYIPTLGSATILPTGVYEITVTPAGNPATTLFHRSITLTAGKSYSFTVEDVPGGSPASAQVILAVDQPVQTNNQSNLMSLIRQP